MERIDQGRGFRAVTGLAASIRLVALAICLGAPIASAQQAGLALDVTVVQPSNEVDGILYRPRDAAQRKGVGILVMHNSQDYRRFFVCEALAARGYTLLCANNRYINLPALADWDNVALDVKAALTFLKQQAGVTKTLLIGHSGGGSVMAWYQAVAENGVGVCNDSKKLNPCGNALANMPAADGMILMDGTPGQAFLRLYGYDPKVTKEDQFGRVNTDFDISLDMFSPANGFSDTKPAYTDAFRSKFFAAQAERAVKLTAMALERKAVIKSGKGFFPDNEPFFVGYHNATLLSFDQTIWSRTKAPHPLISPKGIKDSIVVTNRPSGANVQGNPSSVNQSFGPVGGLGGALKSSVNTFLSGYAINVDPKKYRLTESDILGVDWGSTNVSTPYNVGLIKKPVLFLGATGFFWVVATEMYYDLSPSADKTAALSMARTTITRRAGNAACRWMKSAIPAPRRSTTSPTG